MVNFFMRDFFKLISFYFQKKMIVRKIEKGNIKDIDTSIIRDMYDKSKPTFKQGAYISAIAASLEGGTAFITAIIKKALRENY